jgi:hypothetical protein
MQRRKGGKLRGRTLEFDGGFEMSERERITRSLLPCLGTDLRLQFRVKRSPPQFILLTRAPQDGKGRRDPKGR